MYLKRLELAGFKSFARPTTLEFTTPITAIVGPNGAGKSNIAEAIRFVLGEQSIKSLRGKRSEDLIFHGTKTVSRLNKGTVAIIFDNRKKFFNLDYDEVELKRIVYRDSTSEYFVNGARSRLKDIIELLGGVHIGASSHHIISQGEADRILNVSIKERRAMVEDALGLKIFEYKRAESERKLSKTEENIAHVESLRREISPHLEFLEKQMEKIKQGEALQEELRILYSEYIRNERDAIAFNQTAFDKEREAPRQKLLVVEKKIEERESALKTKDNAEAGNHPASHFDKELATVREKKDAIARALGRLEGMLEREEAEQKKDRAEEGDAKNIIIPERELVNLKTTLFTFLDQAKEAGELPLIRDVLKKIQESLANFIDIHLKNSGKRNDAEIAEAYEKAKKEKQSFENELEKLRNREKEIFELLASEKGNLEKEYEKNRLLERELFELQNTRIELRTALEFLKVREEKIREAREALEHECEEAVHSIGKSAIQIILSEKVEERETHKPEQDARKRKIERLRFKLEDIGGNATEISKEYKEVKERDEFLAEEIADLEKSALHLGGLIKELGEKIDSAFKDGVIKINKEFQTLFSLMFEGGVASLSVVLPQGKKRKKDVFMEEDVAEEEDALEEEGIEVNISLPRKRIKGLAMLSGGERALTSIALIFAITQVNPPPFLVLDETDAALDEANSHKYGELLEDLSKKTQLIIITHNRETMSRAGVLYGVTGTTDGISRLLSIKLEEAVGIAE